MKTQTNARVAVPSELIEAVRAFPAEREVDHCGYKFRVSPFDFYATCPQCRARVKLRAFSGGSEIEDLFDAFFEWLSRPGGADLAKARQENLAADQNSG